MLTRRLVLGALAAAALVAPAHAADDWKAKYPELTFAIVPVENGADTLNRWGPFVDYLSKELGVKVNMRVAQDYAAVIEGQRAGNIQIANFGAASFARAKITGVKTEAFATDKNGDGSTGYYSVFYVLAKSPYQKIEDLKGKNLGLVDPNSTSGNNVPRFELNKHSIKPEDYFGKVVYTGSHENAVLALSQGSVDMAANQWTNDNDSTLQQMLTKGILKHEDGTPFKKDEFRIINTSSAILNGPYVVLSDLPDDLKAAVKKAFLDTATKNKAVYDKIWDGQKQSFTPIADKDYESTIELVKFIDSLRKKS
ncbi:MAG: phosphonate ABC transporter substrate-binding protein [Ancalomicrobiaceae bacterium]|nr:phosphonate ABC transporter substrate-binding protein [Ancalomicrobiaceae bacterium]